MNERSPDVGEMLEYVYELLDLPRATRILDIGCGDGYDLRQIAQRAPGANRFWGIDALARAIRSASQQPHCDARLAFSVVDVSVGLPFEREQFDLIFSNNLLECIPDQSALLHEVHRVLCKEGRVVFAHFDWDTQVIHGSNKALIRKMVHAFGDWQQDWMAACDAWMGRRLWSVFKQSGLFTGRVHAYVLANTDYRLPYYGYARIQDFAGLASTAGLLL